MSIRIHESEDSSESAYEAVAFVVEALASNPTDGDLLRLAERVGALLVDWEELNAEGRRLRRAVVRASAHAHVADATLDAAIATFAKDLLDEVKGDTSAGLYKTFFTDPHEDIIAMGLDSEVPVVTLIVAALDATTDVPAKLKAHLDTLRAGLRLGNGALAGRADAYADLGRHNAREEAWAEASVSSIRSVHRALSRIASTRGLPSEWADAFLPG